MADRRVKRCPNSECEWCGNERKWHRFKAKDKFCTLCGTPLKFVCKDCGKPIEDLGEKHICCARCEAIKVDKHESFQMRLNKMSFAVADAAKAVGGAASAGAAKIAGTGEAVADAAAAGAKHASEVAANIGQSVQDGATLAADMAGDAVRKAEDAANDFIESLQGGKSMGEDAAEDDGSAG